MDNTGQYILQLKIKILANFSPLDTFNVQLADNVGRIVQKRFNNKVIDLTEFHKDPGKII